MEGIKTISIFDGINTNLYRNSTRNTRSTRFSLSMFHNFPRDRNTEYWVEWVKRVEFEKVGHLRYDI